MSLKNIHIILRHLLFFSFLIFPIPSFAETMHYSYDELDRLEKVQYPDGTTIGYSYDNVGNRFIQYINNTDLVPTAVSGPASAKLLEAVTISTTIRNQGQSASEPFRVGFYLSIDNTITIDDRFLGEIPVGALGGGSQTVLDKGVQVPYDLIPGNYYWGVIADYENEALEFDEENNPRAGNNVTIYGDPDLTSEAVSGPTLVTTGQPVTVGGTVKNWGDGDSPSSLVGIYLSVDAIITAGDSLAGQVSIDPLAPGAQQVFTATVMIPSGLADGDYYWGAIADDSGAIPESNEGNNSLAGNTVTLVQEGVRIVGASPQDYGTIQAAYDAAPDGATIRVLGVDYTENVTANRAIGVVIEGGYGPDFQAPLGNTLLHGSLTVTAGTVTIRDFHLRP